MRRAADGDLLTREDMGKEGSRHHQPYRIRIERLGDQRLTDARAIESAVSIKVTPLSTTRRSSVIASLSSLGGPQIPWPVMRIAPKPRCPTVYSAGPVREDMFEGTVEFVISDTEFARRG
jgi:hypothetical protein